jgi:hypothetical protein
MPVPTPDIDVLWSQLVPVRTVRSHAASALLRYGVENVFSGRPKPQVSWIDAARVIAGVADAQVGVGLAVIRELP